jgi:hypothetical protein
MPAFAGMTGIFGFSIARRNVKKPFESGAWAVVAPTLKAQIKRSFLVLFFKKELLPALAS